MPFPVPNSRVRDTAESARDERKRQVSPGSFFFSQGKSQVLAAHYFNDDRLTAAARGGVALKHRHKIHMALYGQLLAAFEYFLKDFIATAIDSTTLLDEKIKREKWLSIDVERVLANRSGMATIGSTLVHSTLGWHSSEQVNARYQSLFGRRAFSEQERETLDKLWILRHTVAHNAGVAVHYDAKRLGYEMLSDHAVDIDAQFINESFQFLSPIARNICLHCGSSLMRAYFQPLQARGSDYVSDRATYTRLKHLSQYVESRTQEMPAITAEAYEEDFNRYSAQ